MSAIQALEVCSLILWNMNLRRRVSSKSLFSLVENNTLILCFVFEATEQNNQHLRVNYRETQGVENVIFSEYLHESISELKSKYQHIISKCHHLLHEYLQNTIFSCILTFVSDLRVGADKSLARNISLCRWTESTVSLERGVWSCAESQVFSCYRD